MIPTKRVEPRYPSKMLALMPRSNPDVKIYTRMEIDALGKAAKVVAEGYPQSRSELQLFEREAIWALSEWEFPPAPEGRTRPRIACYEIVYHLTD